jgi:DNA modification methylase
MKPMPLFDYQIKNSSKKGDAVLDLFGGSGTTLVCCEQIGRDCYMMELDPRYVDVIISRWESMTGEKAVLLNA